MIPVFEPDIGDEEREAVLAALARGEISGSFGTAIPEFERLFADYVGCKHGVAVSSGTTALQLAVAAAGIGPGDEVLVSACTNIATALAVAHNGAVPVPVDSEAVTWNLDLDLVERLITPRTRAIIPVHVYGHPVDMDRLGALAAARRLIVIEDCAESHGATVRGRMTGGFGQMGCFSFYANKIITTGEGGMVTTNDDELAGRLRLLRNLAFTEPRFRHEALGYNFRMTGMQAAMGVAQTRKIEAVIAAKRRLAKAYDEALADIEWLQRPAELAWARNVYWMYGVVIRAESGLQRAAVTEALRADGVDTRTFFCPMNQQPALARLPGFRAAPCPVADGLWERGFYLPSSTKLGATELRQVAAALRRAGAGARGGADAGRRSNPARA
jgi:perosamine synthetase